MNGQIIYEYGKHPVNYGRLNNPTLTYTEKNHTCGENLTLDLILDNDRVVEIGFVSDGRMVGVASMSLLSEVMEDKSFNEIEKFSKLDVLEWLEVESLTSKRLKSALLGLLTFKNAYCIWSKKEKVEFAELLN
jgi:nitrogen fixation protein NifU and related proteins